MFALNKNSSKFSRLIIFGCLLTGLLVAAFIVRMFVPIEHVIENEQRLRSAIAQHPIRSWFIGFGVYALLSFVPGTTGKAMIFGWLFGLWPAVLMADGALTLAAIGTFLIGRYALRDFVHERFGENIERVNRGLRRDGPFYLLMVRLVHTPYTLVNYASGSTEVPVSTFAWTTLVGLLPATIVFVFAGSRLPTLAQLKTEGPLEIVDPWLMAGLAFTAILPIMIRRGLRTYRRFSEQDLQFHRTA